MALKRTGVFLQSACLQHRYIRNQDLSTIVERPERLRAVNIGIAAAIAHLEELLEETTDPANGLTASFKEEDELAAALDKMKIGNPKVNEQAPTNVPIVQSNATVNLLNHPAVKFVHGDIDGDVYLENLKKWAKESTDKIAQEESEIPEGYSQGDLYLCPESIVAIEGALGTACEAVDAVLSAPSSESSKPIHRAFVAIRPPGHHCGEDTPSGFCFVNNVAVAAAHAHLKYGVNRIAIFDIDLHHGNGTQSIVWQVNEETYRQKLEQEAGAPKTKLGPQIYYGSIHDILSYPCEDGKPELVQAASVSLHKSHGQFIENIHLETYSSEEHFWDELYSKKYSKLIEKAAEFFDTTGGPGDDCMVFISCGMDACEHEYESMSRHNRKVPTGYYYQFARDACAFSDKYARGRIISFLEGGYSDRALTSGAMAHVIGLTDIPDGKQVDQEWWSLGNLVELEKCTKKRRGGRPSLPAPGTRRQWIERTISILSPLDSTASSILNALRGAPPRSMTLRDRTKAKSTTPAPGASPKPSKVTSKPRSKPTIPQVALSDTPSSSSSADEASDTKPSANQEPVKVRKVILKLGPASTS